MKKAFILLADGFEETEAMGTWDALRRGGVDAQFVTINDTPQVAGAHGLNFKADHTLREIVTAKVEADAVALPGGMGNAQRLKDSKEARAFIQGYYDDKKVVGAMCAAPMVLGDMGILEGRKATIFPSLEAELKGAEHHDATACIDGHVVTGRGPAYGLHYGVAILYLLEGEAKAREVAEALLLHEKGIETLPFLG